MKDRKNLTLGKMLGAGFGYAVIAAGLSLPAYGQDGTVRDGMPTVDQQRSACQTGRDGELAGGCVLGYDIETRAARELVPAVPAQPGVFEVMITNAEDETETFLVRTGNLTVGVAGMFDVVELSEGGDPTDSNDYDRVTTADGSFRVAEYNGEQMLVISEPIVQPSAGEAEIPAVTQQVRTEGGNSIAIGEDSIVKGENSIAIGEDAIVGRVIPATELVPAVPAGPGVPGVFEVTITNAEDEAETFLVRTGNLTVGVAGMFDVVELREGGDPTDPNDYDRVTTADGSFRIAEYNGEQMLVISEPIVRPRAGEAEIPAIPARAEEIEPVENALAIGDNAMVEQDGGVAIGASAEVTGEDGIAIGRQVSAGENQIRIGAGDQTDVRIGAYNLEIIDTDIETNRADITTNRAGIATNLVSIDTNRADITGNTASIDTNRADITTNRADITTNRAGIATNLASIDTNRAGIATNLASIDTNRAGIATNLASINTNLASINTNRAGIATNLASINTNRASIDTNRAGIAAAVALASLPVINGARGGWSIAAGSFDSETGIAIGANFNVLENATIRVGISTSSGETSGAVGFGMGF